MTIKESLFEKFIIPTLFNELNENWNFTTYDLEPDEYTSKDPQYQKDIKEFSKNFNTLLEESSKVLGVNLNTEVSQNNDAAEMMFKYIMEHNCDS